MRTLSSMKSLCKLVQMGDSIKQSKATRQQKSLYTYILMDWDFQSNWVILSLSLFLLSILFSVPLFKPKIFLSSWGFLILVSCTMSWTSIHSSLGTLSITSSPLNLYFSLPLYSNKGFDLNCLVVFPTFFYLSLDLAIGSSWSEPQSAPSLVFADCIELLHIWLQRI